MKRKRRMVHVGRQASLASLSPMGDEYSIQSTSRTDTKTPERHPNEEPPFLKCMQLFSNVTEAVAPPNLAKIQSA